MIVRIYISVLILLVLIISICACDREGPDAGPASLCTYKLDHLYKDINEGPAFPGTQLISVPAFESDYDSILGDDLYVKNLAPLINGLDCCKTINEIGQVSVTPTLKWQLTGDSLMAAAIFKGRPDINFQGDKIQNVETIVWAWHNKITNAFSRSGNTAILYYRYGRAVVGGEIMEDSLAAELEPNTGYTFIVWAWNREATKVIRSSREIFFVTEGEAPAVSLQRSNQKIVLGKWALDPQLSENVDHVPMRLSFTTGTSTYELESGKSVVSSWTVLDDNVTNLTSLTMQDLVFRNVIVTCNTISAIMELTVDSKTITASVFYRREK